MTTTENTLARVEDFPEQESNGSGMIQVAQSRAAQEVQAAMIVAQRFPRDQNKAFTRIMAACSRKSLAERSSYMYPKGGQNVTGPSIRLAEVLAREWGNIDSGIVELEQKPDESVMMSYAWDLETNTRSTKIFTVKHVRHTRKGDYQIEDPREIYELTANQGARRLRACILAIIPGDIVEAALEQCDKALTGSSKEPLADRIRKMLTAFVEMGVTQEMIEAKLGHKMEATAEQELVNLRKVYTSLRDGFGSREDFFDATPKPSLQDFNKEKNGKTKAAEPAPAATVQQGAAEGGDVAQITTSAAPVAEEQPRAPDEPLTQRQQDLNFIEEAKGFAPKIVGEVKALIIGTRKRIEDATDSQIGQIAAKVREKIDAE